MAKAKLRAAWVVLLCIGGIVFPNTGPAEITYDAGKNVINIAGQDINSLEEIAAQLDIPEVFSYDQAAREARSTASIAATRGNVLAIGNPDEDTTLTFVCAPEAAVKSYFLTVNGMASVKIMNTTIQAHGSGEMHKAPSGQKFLGVNVLKCANVTISDCRITDALRALGLTANTGARVHGLSIANSHSGIAFHNVGAYELANMDISTYGMALKFLSFTGTIELSDCNIRTRNQDRHIYISGNPKNATPNITLTSVSCSQRGINFRQTRTVVSIAWYATLRVVDEEGAPVSGANVRFTPRCEFAPAENMGFLVVEPTDEKGELRTALIEGILAKESPGHTEMVKGHLYPYTYRIEMEEGGVLRVLDDSLSLQGNVSLEYRRQGNTYTATR